MEKEQPLPDPPQRSGPKFVAGGHSLVNPIGQVVAHVMQGKIGEGMILNVTHTRVDGLRRCQVRRVTQCAPGVFERLSSRLNVAGGKSRGSWSRHPDSIYKRIDIGTTGLRMCIFRRGIENATLDY